MSMRLLKSLAFIAFIVACLLGICVFRTLVYYNLPEEEAHCSSGNGHNAITDTDGLVKRFSEALRFKTITTAPLDYDSKELARFIQWIQTTYPTVHRSPYVKLELVKNFTMLYTIQGSDASLKPYMLCSHLDVVPVELDKWTVDPFAGTLKDDYIYGRGAIDVKDSLIGILETLEHLFKLENFKPRRTIILAFGHDEEGSGLEGAAIVGEILKSRKIQLEYLLDEGTFIFKNSIPGVNNPIAYVAVAEKGYVTMELTARGQNGHSSVPPTDSAILKLTKALGRLEPNAFPSMFGTGPEVAILESVAPYASFVYRLAYSNLWLFSGLISHLFGQSASGNSLIRTTTAITVINSGFKDNVLPAQATALVNHRIHPTQTIEEVIQMDRKLINNDEIELRVYKDVKFEAHPFSPYDSAAFGFNAIKRSIRQVFDNTIVVPGIMVASTDSKHYLHLTKAIYRFTPIVLYMNETKLFHGNDERISVANYQQLVNFYHHLILMSDHQNLHDRLPIHDEL